MGLTRGQGAVLLLVVLLLAGCTATAGAPAAKAPDTRSTVERSGTGIMSTDRFPLEGDYRLDWTATDHGKYANSGCYHGVSLRPGLEGRVSTTVDHQRTMSGSTYAYGLRAGMYYIEANSGCAWTVTLVPV